MIFRRKKQPEEPAATSVMRGRANVENETNPLARRFSPVDEPDTIDLTQPAGFPAEPDTADLAAKKPDPQGLAVITLVSETGKLYAQPGNEQQAIQLEGEPVMAPTELRPGDRIRTGNLELQVSRIPEKA